MSRMDFLVGCELRGGVSLQLRGMTELGRGVRLVPLTEMGYTFGMPTCPNCGLPLDDNLLACEVCGEERPLRKQPQLETKSPLLRQQEAA